MFGVRLAGVIKKDKKIRRIARNDVISEQVRKVLETEDQKLILMVRG